MEKFLKAATQVWNPVREVQRRLDEHTLTLSEVLAPSIAAIIACNLFRMAAWNFFWNSTFHGLGSGVPELKTNEFLVQLGSTIGALMPIAALAVMPAITFQPFGRAAVGAAFLMLAAALSFYEACFDAIGYFVAGAQGWENPQLGLTTFMFVNGLVVIAEIALAIYFWSRIGLSVLHLSTSRFVAITLVAICGVALLVMLVLLASASSSS